MSHVKAGSTREGIIMLLKTTGAMTVNEISQALGITPMGVRQHLNQLVSDGYVDTHQKRGKVGRPGYVYSLNESANELFPSGYEQLVSTLLDTLQSLGGDEAVKELFFKRSQRQAASFLEQHADKPLEEKVHLLAQLQDDAGYLTEVEEEDDGNTIRLREHHCAIATVANRYPYACQAELNTFRTVFEEARVSRTSCITKGDQSCEYVIQLAPPAPEKNSN